MSYQGLAQSLEEFIGKTFNDWADSVERELQRYLEVPLMKLKYVTLYIEIQHYAPPSHCPLWYHSSECCVCVVVVECKYVYIVVVLN